MSTTQDNKTEITTDDILNIATLSRLAVTTTTAGNYAKDINKILTMMDTLADVNTDDIKPLSNVHDAYQILRVDATQPNIDRELNMENAPAKQDGLFLVPKVVE